MATDVKKEAAKDKPAQQDAQPDRAKPAPKPKKKHTSSINKAAINIGIHSVLMVVVPFSIFFASAYGFLDPVFERTFGIPKKENKTVIGAVLAVLVVQVVIASFVISAFREEVAEPDKED